MGGAAPARFPGRLVLDRFRPLRPLGSGGSGSVWLALDEPTGREVALKIVPREGNAGSRAEREAATAARLRHPRCLRAFALARDSEHVYIAYEYVPGRTLRDELRRGDLGDGEVLEIAMQILEGLAHAHAHGIVHRDVKPSNVLLVDGPHLSVRLLDFGLALINEEETLTAVGDVPGTLAYISPERLRGRKASPAADVWAVGVLLWEGLAGRHPFWRPSLLGTARAIQSGAPQLASARPDLPGQLTDLVDRALAADPSRRPPAAKLVGGLRRAAAARGRRSPGFALPRIAVPRRAADAAAACLAAAAAGYGASALPFYPSPWPPVLAGVAALFAFLHIRSALALTLAVPVLPLGNLSVGLAVVYAAVALTWLALFWRRPGDGLLVAAGPLAAPLAALALLPLVVERCRGVANRALLGAAGVLVAGLTAGLAHRSMPLTDGEPPAALRLGGTEQPGEVAAVLGRALLDQPALVREAIVLGAAAALLPVARRHGPWWSAVLAGGMLAALLGPDVRLDPVPVTVSAWAIWLWLVAGRVHPARVLDVVRICLPGRLSPGR
ncbi:MAG: protein kinase [Gaiellaceae bacterium]